MKKAPKKPRTPKPKAPKSSKIKQKQKQSVNVKIHINNSRPARRGAAAAAGHRSPFPQPITSYPIFRDVPPSPSVHYNPEPVVQAPVVAQGFHGIPAQAPVAAPAQMTPRRQIPRDRWNDTVEPTLSFGKIYNKDSDEEFFTPPGNTRDLVNKFEKSGKGSGGSSPELTQNLMSTQVRDPTSKKTFIDIGGTKYNQLLNSGVYVAGARGGLSKKKGG